MKSVSTLATAALLGAVGPAGRDASAGQTIDVRLGYQHMCTDTYPAGTAVMGLKLLEKHLPHDGKYAGVTYNVQWQDYPSGAPITNMMLGGKLEFGTMGDYPLVVNGAKFQATAALRSELIVMTAYNLDGAGNGIVVPAASEVRTVEQLVGKPISVPIGSSAWGMLYKMAADHHIPFEKLTVVNQQPMIGIAAIAGNKIAAHADFCPNSEFMQFNGTGRLVYSGSDTNVPYLHGAVVRQDFARKYPEVVVAYCKAVVEADRWIRQDPLNAARQMAQWTMIPKEVLYLYFSKGGVVTPDPTIKPAWLGVLKDDHALLARHAQIPPLDLKPWVNDGYLKEAYRGLGLDYDREVAEVVAPRPSLGLPAELWLERDGIREYPTVDALLADYRRQGEAKAQVNAAYVYDAARGLKLFATAAFYAADAQGRLRPYLYEADAQKAGGGKALTFAEAVQAASAVSAAR